jgi:hypothetical protein
MGLLYFGVLETIIVRQEYNHGCLIRVKLNGIFHTPLKRDLFGHALKKNLVFLQFL